MGAQLEHEPKPVVLFGSLNKPCGSYLVFRCEECPNIHVSASASLAAAEIKGTTVGIQLALSPDEARQLAAELLATAEEH